jgi:hypothetical protein
VSDSPNPYAAPADESQVPPLVAEVVVDEAGWTIEFELTPSDWVSWNEHCHSTSPTLRRQFFTGWLMVALCVLFMAILMPAVMVPHAERMSVSITILVVGVIFLALFPMLMRRRNRRLMSAIIDEDTSYNVIGPRRLTLSDNYVAYSSPLTQSIVRWQGITQVYATQNALYILLSSLQAIIAPRRVFASQAEFEQFGARAKECFERGKRSAT